MNFLAWNCRGVGAKGFSSLIKDMKREYQSSLMFLLETHSSGVKAKNQIKKLGFSGNYIVDSRGQSGGIWCVWDKAIWSVEVVEFSHHLSILKWPLKGNKSG